MYLNQLKSEEPSSLKLLPIKFVRRPELDETVRVKIAVIAKYFKQHCTVTNLAKQYDISRTFIYMQVHLLNQMVNCWFVEDKVPSFFFRTNRKRR